MKRIFLLLTFCNIYYLLSAQWSDTQNKFYDSLLMPVTSTAGNQFNPVIIRSYPDGGYFVIWQDDRNGDKDIFAQKYSNKGKSLWTANGVPVATGAYDQFYDAGDYRFYNHACTDSAGGFYIAFENGASTGLHSSYVQHIKSSGKRVFSGIGYLLLQSDYYSVVSPELIADGNDGFYVGYLRVGAYGERDVFVSSYRDENGILHNYGGGQMNLNAYDRQESSPCGIQNYILYADGVVNDYMLYSDKQGGCNVAMAMTINNGTSQNAFIGFNRLCRVKKNCTATIRKRVDSIASTKKVVIHYPKDSVVRLYSLTTYSNTVICGSDNIYVVTSYYIENGGEGYLPVSDYYYNVNTAKGLVATTSANINADVIAFDTRNLNGNSVTDYHVHAVSIPEEIYDSIPYQLTSNGAGKPYYAYNTKWPSGYPALGSFSDTLLYDKYSSYGFNYSFATAANRIFAAASTDQAKTLLQEIDVTKINADSFAIKLKTPTKSGVITGATIYKCCTWLNENFSDPQVVGDDKGNAVFSVTDYGRYVRISPIDSNAQLRWGAMGRPIGSAGAANLSSLYMDPSNATGLIAFHNYGASGLDIFMRHLDALNASGFPPLIKLNRFNYGYTDLAPQSMTGSSKVSSLFEGWGYGGRLNPAFELTDIYNLGGVESSIYEEPENNHRSYNGRYYLGRNFAIVSDSALFKTITVRFYFTQAQFDSLKAVAHSVNSPADLVAIQQPIYNGAYEYYNPVAGEKTLTPSSTKSVNGGYYAEFKTKSLGNFFLFEKGNADIVSNSIAAAFDNNFIKRVYPSNIEQGQLHIETGNMKCNNMLIELYSADGTLLLQRKLMYHSQTIPLSVPVNGIYTMKISNGNNIFTTNIFKIK